MKSIRKTNEEKGWESAGPELFAEKMLLVISEITEALEEFRDHRGLNEIYYNEDKPGKPEGIPIEIADAVIRIFDWCEANKVDLENALTLKMLYNKSRPFRHGGRKV
jgi:hypothetical protein